MIRATILLLLLAVPSTAAPPVVVLADAKGDPGAFVTLKANVTGATVVKFVPLDGGLNLFPSELLTDKTALVVTGTTPGKYRVLAYAGNADGASDPVIATITINGTAPIPSPGPTPQPGPDPVKAAKLAVVICEETAQRTVAQAGVMNDVDLRKWVHDNGHYIANVDKDSDVYKTNGYSKYGESTALPFVLVFDDNANGPSKPLKVFPLPSTAADFSATLKGLVK